MSDKKREFEVIVTANSSHEIACHLESVDAAEGIETETKKRIDEEVKKIGEYAVVIDQ